MTCNNDRIRHDHEDCGFSRREVIQAVAATGAALVLQGRAPTVLAGEAPSTTAQNRFPHFQSTPVSYLNVEMQDDFWAPRQKVVLEVSLPWATRHLDEAGGLEAFRQDPQGYATRIRSDWQAVEFLESLAAAVGLQRNAAVEGLTEAWGRKMIASQEADGYWPFGWPATTGDPAKRWQAVWWSHEDYALGYYIDAALGYREAIGKDALYHSAVRAVDNMAATLVGSSRSYAPGMQRIEEALMHLYGATGDAKPLELCGWLIGQRGHHDGRRSFGRYSQDHLPIEAQRTIEGHAVRAANLFNGVTEYVGATGHAGYRAAVLAVWQDFVDHKMYLHGAGGLTSTHNEGYSVKPDFIPPDDCYGESCAVFGNFQWAHNLFRLTGDAAYLDVAERMLYNAFYASLSLQGDSYFYENVMQQDRPTGRFAWHKVPCCPPNIVKLFCKVGGFFYSTDADGIFVKHYGASAAHIPFAGGVKLTQRTGFPWDGRIALQMELKRPATFTLRLRVPAWARSHALAVSGKSLNVSPQKGWLAVRRRWSDGDTVELSLPMEVKRVSMPSRFKEYENLVALQRGPIVYCVEEQDMNPFRTPGHLDKDVEIAVEHRPDLLGGVTVLKTVPRTDIFTNQTIAAPATFIPYGVWNNRTPGAMRMWVKSAPPSPGNAMPLDPFGTEAES